MKSKKLRILPDPKANNPELADNEADTARKQIEEAEKKRADDAAEKAARRKMVIAAATEGNDYMAGLLGAVVLVREGDGQKAGLCDRDRQNIARSHAAIKEALSYLGDGDGK